MMKLQNNNNNNNDDDDDDDGNNLAWSFYTFILFLKS